MAITIDSVYVNKFNETLHLLLEQNGSKLRGIFPIEQANGEKHFFDRLGTLGAVEQTSALQPNDLQDPALSRRMATVNRYFVQTSMDDLDKYKMAIDPTSDLMKKIANGLGKQYDSVVLAALLGTAATGKDGSGSQAFDTTNQQIVDGGTGLTIAKFDQALRILEEAEVDIHTDEVVLIVGARGLEDLLTDTSNRIVSADFQNNKPLSGKGQFMYRGVTIVKSERIPQFTAGSVNRALLCTRDCLKVAMTHDFMSSVTELPQFKGNPLKIEASMMMGAVRMEEARIVSINYTV